MANSDWFRDNTRLVANVIDQRTRLGMRRVIDFLTDKTKEILSTPAPKRLINPRFGAPYFRATTPATPGAPPRLLSGNLRSSIFGAVRGNGAASWGFVGTDCVYGAYQEKINHPFVTEALRRYGSQARMILVRAYRKGGTSG